MKKPVISMMIHKGNTLLVNGILTSPGLPEGCLGIMFVFESKKAARAFDKKAQLLEIKRGDKK